MSRIDDAQNTMAAAFLGCSDPADRLRYAAVALAQADMLTDPERAERQRVELRDLRSDALAIRGLLSPSGRPSRVPMELGDTLAPAVEWLLAENARMRAALIVADEQLQRAEAVHAEPPAEDLNAPVPALIRAIRALAGDPLPPIDTADPAEDGSGGVVVHLTPATLDDWRSWTRWAGASVTELHGSYGTARAEVNGVWLTLVGHGVPALHDTQTGGDA